jgi:2-oxoglutarate ferredoxin oxidoreductase subunit gamma
MKNARIMNMIILGAYLQLKPVVKTESIMEALKKVLPEKYHNLLPINQQALEKGAALVQQLQEAVA